MHWAVSQLEGRRTGCGPSSSTWRRQKDSSAHVNTVCDRLENGRACLVYPNLTDLSIALISTLHHVIQFNAFDKELTEQRAWQV